MRVQPHHTPRTVPCVISPFCLIWGLKQGVYNMKESHYNMCMTNVEKLDTSMGQGRLAASIKRNLKFDPGKYVLMYRARIPILCLRLPNQ